MQAILGHGCNLEAIISSSGKKAVNIASEQSSTQCLVRLIELGCGISHVTTDGKTLMMHAKSPDAISVIHAAASGLLETPRTSDGLRPLAMAAIGGDAAGVRRMVELGADINAADSMGNNATIVSADIQITDYLVSNGGDVTKKNNVGFSALHFAAIMGRDRLVESLVFDYKLDINARESLSHTSALNMAIKCERPAVVETILACASRKEQGKLLLIYMFQQNPIHARLLPLHQAIRSNQVNIVSMLMRQIAKYQVNTPVKGDNTCHMPLHMAVEHASTDMLELLVRHGADTELVNGRGQTPLYYAALLGKTDMVCKLLALGANPNSTQNRNGPHIGETPLYGAMYMPGDNAACVQELLDAGAEPTYTVPGDNRRMNLVFLAALNNKPSILETLLAQPGTTRFIDRTVYAIQVHGTPVHAAVLSESVACIEALATKGATMTMVSGDGQTPYAMACDWHQQNVVQGRSITESGRVINALRDAIWQRNPEDTMDLTLDE